MKGPCPIIGALAQNLLIFLTFGGRYGGTVVSLVKALTSRPRVHLLSG